MIPRTVWQIWLQGCALPPVIGGLVDGARWVAHRCGWGHALVSEADLTDTDLLDDGAREVLAQLWPRCCDRAQRADVARYLLLRSRGGLYLDADVELFDLPDALSGTWIAGTGGGAVNNCALSAECGSPFLSRVFDRVCAADLGRQLTATAAAVACLGPDVEVWPRHVWHGQRGRPGDLGHHYGWGYRLGTYQRYPGVRVPAP